MNDQARCQDCMSAILDIVREHHVCVDPSIMVCAVTCLVLEGWQYRLDPGNN